MANLTISLDENLVKQARIKAIQEGTSLSAKVREMLAAYVRQDSPSTPVVIAKLPVSAVLAASCPVSTPAATDRFTKPWTQASISSNSDDT
jgi:plasmid stability protein